MPSEATTKALNDIAYHIDLAEEFSKDLGRHAFMLDLKTIYAVTRCLEIISEASRRLSAEIKARHNNIEWRAMAAAGNIYRHEYEDVAASRVWTVLQYELKPLRLAVEAELRRDS